MGLFERLHGHGTLRAGRIVGPLLGLAMGINLSLPGEPAPSLPSALLVGSKSDSFRLENRLPTAPDAISAQEGGAPNQKRAEDARKDQIASDSAKLLQMAIELKAEMDKSSKETLSLNIVRKADAITRLAHDLKEEMKQQKAGEN